MKEFRNPEDVHEPLGSYSHQIEIGGNERMLIISGQPCSTLVYVAALASPLYRVEIDAWASRAG